MKNVLTGTIFMVFILSIFSFSTKQTLDIEQGNVKWYTWQEAVEASKKEKKKIFIDIYTDWCGWCKRMDKATFEDPEVAKFLNENFYPVKMNAEMKDEIVYNNHTFKFVASGRKGYHQLAAALLDGRLSYPTTVFLNEEFEIMQRIPGFMDANQFSMVMEYLAGDYDKKISWEEFQVQYAERKKL